MSVPGSMSDDTRRLMQAIALLSAAPEPTREAGRKLRPSDETASNALDLLLAEINETVLRRDLIFENEGRQVFELEITERRIIRVIEAPAHLKNLAPNLFDRALTSEDAPQLMTVMRTYCEGTDTLSVVSRLPKSGESGTFDGVSCHELIRHKEFSSGTDALPPEFATALGVSKPTARAIFCSEGLEQTFEWGAQDQCLMLSRLVAAGLASSEDRALRLWQGELAENLAILLAKKGAHSVWLLFPGTDVSRHFETWHAAIFSAENSATEEDAQL